MVRIIFLSIDNISVKQSKRTNESRGLYFQASCNVLFIIFIQTKYTACPSFTTTAACSSYAGRRIGKIT